MKTGNTKQFYNTLFNYYLDRLIKITMACFKWHNLPNSCDERYMEEILVRQGKVLFFRDDELNLELNSGNETFLCLPCTIEGMFDYNHNPIQRMGYADNGYQWLGNQHNSVIIYNNNIKTNGMTEILMYARDLTNLHQTINMNIHTQKTPFIIKVEESQKLTMQNLYLKYDGNIPIIYADKSLDIDSIQVLKTDSPFVADKLFVLLTQKWNEYLTLLGVDNIQTQKKERMISDEVTTALGAINLNRQTRLETRQKACKQINDMFGLNIEVEFIGDSINDTTDFDINKQLLNGGDDNE